MDTQQQCVSLYHVYSGLYMHVYMFITYHVYCLFRNTCIFKCTGTCILFPVSISSLPWIRGCRVRDHVMEVMVDPLGRTLDEVRGRLLEVSGLPEGALRVTEHIQQVHYQASCKRYGSGSEVKQQRFEVDGAVNGATVTAVLIAHSTQDLYAITVAHCVDTGYHCSIYCCCGLGASRKSIQGLTEARIYSNSSSSQSDIHMAGDKDVRPVWDMALVSLEQIPDLYNNITNSRTFVIQGTAVELKPKLEKRSQQFRDIIRYKEFFVFKNESCFKAVFVDYINRPNTEGNKHTFQCVAFRIRSPQAGCHVIQQGDSGSLVTLPPDPEGKVTAVGLVLGMDLKDPEVAVVAPLWESLEELCRSDSRFSGMVRDLDFPNPERVSVDSGYLTDVCQNAVIAGDESVTSRFCV